MRVFAETRIESANLRHLTCTDTVPRKTQTPGSTTRRLRRRAKSEVYVTGGPAGSNNITGMATEPILNATIAPAFAAAGDLKSRLFKHEQFASNLVDEKHTFIVYVPPLYAAEQERLYPVLFMQDGQNLFDPETSFVKGNHWRMGETADALIEAGEIEPLVIVGIYNTGERRIDEYTPVEDRRLGGGQA